MKSIHVPEINFVEQTIRNKSYELNGKVAEIKSPKSISYVVRWQLAKKRSGSAKTKNMCDPLHNTFAGIHNPTEDKTEEYELK